MATKVKFYMNLTFDAEVSSSRHDVMLVKTKYIVTILFRTKYRKKSPKEFLALYRLCRYLQNGNILLWGLGVKNYLRVMMKNFNRFF